MSARVSDEHGREVSAFGERGGVDGIALAGGGGDGDGGAVHVHFAIADFVEPGPRESVLTRADAFRNGELELGGAVAVWILGQIASGVDGTPTQDGVDDLPRGGCGWVEICGERDLAGTTAVGGTADEGEGLVDTDGHGVAGPFCVIHP